MQKLNIQARPWGQHWYNRSVEENSVCLMVVPCMYWYSSCCGSRQDDLEKLSSLSSFYPWFTPQSALTLPLNYAWGLYFSYEACLLSSWVCGLDEVCSVTAGVQPLYRSSAINSPQRTASAVCLTFKRPFPPLITWLLLLAHTDPAVKPAHPPRRWMRSALVCRVVGKCIQMCVHKQQKVVCVILCVFEEGQRVDTDQWILQLQLNAMNQLFPPSPSHFSSISVPPPSLSSLSVHL